MQSIYLHVPFCSSICYYCGFSRFKIREDLKKEWLTAVLKESKDTLSRMNASSGFLSTLYFGGGTPTCLSLEEFNGLCAPFLPYINENTEFTVECNPEHIDQKRAENLAANKVNRVSLGVQTFSNPLLKSIGRHHDKDMVFKAVRELKKAGIRNISIDLIFALPDQRMEDVMKDLETFFELDIDHLSIYSLQVEENSRFGKMGVQPVDEELEAAMYEHIVSGMKAKGYEHYEISSFARHQACSRHNLAYWQDQDYAGIGYGSCGRENGVRYEHAGSLKEYVQSPLEKTEDASSRADAPFEAIMMALRTQFGLCIPDWSRKYHQDFYQRYESVLNKYINHGLFVENGFLKADESGMEILNTILVDFMD